MTLPERVSIALAYLIVGTTLGLGVAMAGLHIYLGVMQ